MPGNRKRLSHDVSAREEVPVTPAGIDVGSPSRLTAVDDANFCLRLRLGVLVRTNRGEPLRPDTIVHPEGSRVPENPGGVLRTPDGARYLPIGVPRCRTSGCCESKMVEKDASNARVKITRFIRNPYGRFV